MGRPEVSNAPSRAASVRRSRGWSHVPLSRLSPSREQSSRERNSPERNSPERSSPEQSSPEQSSPEQSSRDRSNGKSSLDSENSALFRVRIGQSIGATTGANTA